MCCHTYTPRQRSARFSAQITNIYLTLMLTGFLLYPGTQGYTHITAAKSRMFLALGLGYCAVCAGFYLRRLFSGLYKALTLPALLRRLGAARLCMLGYLVCSLISTLFSPYRTQAWLGGSRREGMLTIAVYTAIFLLVSLTAQPGRWLLDVLGASMTAFCAICILQLAGRNPLSLYPAGLNYYDSGTAYTGAFLGPTGNVGLTAAVLCMAVPVFFLAAARLRRWRLLVPGALCAGVLAWMGVAAGIVGTLGSFWLCSLAQLPSRRARRMFCGCSAALLAGALLAVFLLPQLPGTLGEVQQLLHGTIQDSFGSGRIFIWRNIWPVIWDRPLFGGGPDTLALRVQAQFERFDAASNVLYRASIDAAHNEYLNIWVNQGLFALLCWLGALGISAVRFFQRSQRPAVLLGCSAVTAYAIQALFGISMCMSTPFFLLAWAIALHES